MFLRKVSVLTVGALILQVVDATVSWSELARSRPFGLLAQPADASVAVVCSRPENNKAIL